MLRRLAYAFTVFATVEMALGVDVALVLVPGSCNRDEKRRCVDLRPVRDLPLCFRCDTAEPLRTMGCVAI